MEQRRQFTPKYKPIKSYAVIGNTRTAALVNLDGSIDWCCLPRFDSPSIFGCILDAQQGGRFTVSPVADFKSSQNYISNTNILRTSFQTKTGIAELTDFMPCFSQDGMITALPEIHRRLECTEGDVELQLRFDPKPNYGMNTPQLKADSSSIIASYADETLLLTARGTAKNLNIANALQLHRNETIWLALHFSKGVPPPGRWEPQSEDKLSRTTNYWKNWIRTCQYEGRWREVVHRSALTLKLLSYSPTGTLVAAATTSLPEAIGGSRNWDYRYTWIRDSFYALQALSRLGYRREGKAYTRWLRSKCRRGISRLQIMFDVDGGADLPELELPHLEGYMRSHPVRVGNAASAQFQLDTYGTILDAIHFLHKEDEGVPQIEYDLFVRGLADFICETYGLPDSGIWESRNGPKQYVYSKLWCWVGLDRAIQIAVEMNRAEDARKWRRIRRRIKEEILTEGWSEERKCFRQHYATTQPDSSNLLMPIVGFLPSTHPKVVMNLETTVRELGHDGLIYRYKTKDDAPAREGTFTLCSLWHVQCLAKMGRVQEAVSLFERLLQHGNHVGLFSEEIDPKTGEALGNYPQAFTHLNLINAALELDNALKRKNVVPARRESSTAPRPTLKATQ